VAELVKEKGKSNFCDYFVFMESSDSRSPDAGAETARRALDDLFKK
jgi:hypothetical protein